MVNYDAMADSVSAYLNLQNKAEVVMEATNVDHMLDAFILIELEE